MGLYSEYAGATDSPNDLSPHDLQYRRSLLLRCAWAGNGLFQGEKGCPERVKAGLNKTPADSGRQNSKRFLYMGAAGPTCADAPLKGAWKQEFTRRLPIAGGNLYDCTASMVIYNNPPEVVRRTAASFLDTDFSVHLTIVDNSSAADLRYIFDGLPVFYHFYGENVGYGRAHNWAIFHAEPSKYHLVLNPDILIPTGTIRSLITFIENNSA